MIRTFALILLLSLTSNAQVELQYFFNKKPLTIYRYDDQRVTTSFRCDKLRQNHFCEELKFLKDLKSYSLKKELHSGQSFGSAVCNEKLSGIVVLAKTAEGNQNAFCKLNDELYVELGTLGYYLNLRQ